MSCGFVPTSHTLCTDLTSQTCDLVCIYIYYIYILFIYILYMYIWLYMIMYIYIYYIWRFPKLRVPPVLIQFSSISSMDFPWDHPAMGVPPWLWNPPGHCPIQAPHQAVGMRTSTCDGKSPLCRKGCRGTDLNDLIMISLWSHKLWPHYDIFLLSSEWFTITDMIDMIDMI